MSRYIKIITTANTEVWINSDHIVSLHEHSGQLSIRLVNGDQFASLAQDSIDILSMLNLDIKDNVVAVKPGTPARTGMHRTLTNNGWSEWNEVTL